MNKGKGKRQEDKDRTGGREMKKLKEGVMSRKLGETRERRRSLLWNRR